ncbi:MAG TPA: hypothetical protein VFW33_02005 [Gemmataceae bacterium]|nr:hypothetical protein [Gemmataceae bacterium]
MGKRIGRRHEKRLVKRLLELNEISTANIHHMARVVAEVDRRGERVLAELLPKTLPPSAIPRLRKIGQALLVLDDETVAVQKEIAEALALEGPQALEPERQE